MDPGNEEILLLKQQLKEKTLAAMEKVRSYTETPMLSIKDGPTGSGVCFAWEKEGSIKKNQHCHHVRSIHSRTPYIQVSSSGIAYL